MLRCFLIILFVLNGAVIEAEEPKTFSVNRYGLLWQMDAFKNSAVQDPAPAPIQTPVPEQPVSEWGVAGVFSLHGKQGAILMNSRTNAIEQVGTDEDSPSGMRLFRIHDPKIGQFPGVEVTQNGKRIFLTGITARPAKISPIKAKTAR